MSYEAATGTVIYRSKRHAGLERSFQVMPGAEWPALCCKHIPVPLTYHPVPDIA